MTDAELAILSLLAEGPTTDHELGKLIDARGLRRWTAIGASSMYYVLDKLVKQGLIRQLPKTDNGRRFEISPAGIGVLQTAVSDLLSTPHTGDKSFELGVANMHILKSSQVRSALLNRRQDIAMQITKLHGILEREQQDGAFQAEWLFSHRVYMLECELLWLDKFIDAWETQAPPDPELVIEPAIIPRSRQVILPQDPESIHKQGTREVPPHRRITPPAIETRAIGLAKVKSEDEPTDSPAKDEDSHE